jgi:hypothetical protein
MTLDSRINNMHWNYWFWLLCITLSSKFVKQNAEKDYNIYSVSKLVQTTYICSLLHSDCLSDPFWFVRKSIFWELCYFHQKSLLTWLRSTNRDKDLFFSTNNLKIDETGEEGLISWSRTKLLMVKNEFSVLRFFRTLDSMYIHTCLHSLSVWADMYTYTQNFNKVNFVYNYSNRLLPRLPDFSWYKIPKREKIFQITTNYTKCP